jgi:hypothetical protein
MKRIMILVVLLVGLSTLTEAKNYKQIYSHGSFYSHLAPHGVWMQFDDGLVVWRPTIMRRGWAPYSIGRWIWTDYGWYWDSYESFGYITYHYGRWYYDDYYGWIWTPDYDWAPAWVEWRYDTDYIGWAPLPPYAAFSINVGVHFTFNYVTPYHHWQFVKYNYMCDPYVYKHYIGPKYKYRVFSNTKYRNEYGYSNGRIINRGIDIGEVRTRSGQDIKLRTLERVNDSRDLTRKDRERNNDVVKIFNPTREELQRDNVQNTDFRKVERRSTLETSRLQLGDRNDDNRTIERKRNDDSREVVKEREMKDNDTHERQRTSDENQKIESMKRENERQLEKQRSQERIEMEKRREDSRSLNVPKQKENRVYEKPQKRNDVTDSRSNEMEIRKERNIEIQRGRSEVKTERKIETNKKENPTFNRGDEQKRNDSRNNEQKQDNERRISERTRNR